MINRSENIFFAHLVFNRDYYLLHANEIPDDLFAQPELRKAFTALKEIISEGIKPNAIILSQRIKVEDSFAMITTILSDYDMYADIEEIREFLIDSSKQRKMNLAISEAHAMNDWKESIQHLTIAISEINEIRTNEIKTIAHEFKELFELIDRNNRAEGLTGIGTGLTLFDKFSGGVQLSDLIIIAGRTSQGKTSLALTIARNATIEFKCSAAIFSFEMSKVQITGRLASMESDISSKEILMGKLSFEKIAHLHKSIGNVTNVNLFLDGGSSQINYIFSKMMSYILTNQVKLFIVDYLQLVRNEKKGQNREQEIGNITRMFKNFARENNVAIILLSQLSRSDSSEPNMSHLRDSGQIEEAADIIMLVYRPEVYGIEYFDDLQQEPTSGKAKIIIAKGRNIGLAHFKLNFIKELTKFVNETQENYHPTIKNFSEPNKNDTDAF